MHTYDRYRCHCVTTLKLQEHLRYVCVCILTSSVACKQHCLHKGTLKSVCDRSIIEPAGASRRFLNGGRLVGPRLDLELKFQKYIYKNNGQWPYRWCAAWRENILLGIAWACTHTRYIYCSFFLTLSMYSYPQCEVHLGLMAAYDCIW